MLNGSNTARGVPTSSDHFFWISNQVRFQSSGYWACQRMTSVMVWWKVLCSGMAFNASRTTWPMSLDVKASEYMVAT